MGVAERRYRGTAFNHFLVPLCKPGLGHNVQACGCQVGIVAPDVLYAHAAGPEIQSQRYPDAMPANAGLAETNAAIGIGGCSLTNDTLSGTIRNMRKATRFSKSFTIDGSILDYLQRTRSSLSRSERVNELLRRAIREEQYEALEREAAEFFAAAGKQERAESQAFAAASQRAITREDE
jgi:hypothetical protein